MLPEEKEKNLIQLLQHFNSLALCYSGNLESTYLLKVAVDVLGSDHVLAVVMSSDLFPEEDFNHAVDLASSYDVQVLGLEMHELKNPRVAANTPKSWYYSRKLAYQTMKENINIKEYPVLADSFLMDDLEDFKPGLKARDEEQVRSLLEEAKLYKKEIEILKDKHQITKWNKTNGGNIASRFPYGTHLSQKKVKKVYLGEDYLKHLGFSQVRARIHNDIVRIEILKKDFPRFIEKTTEINVFFQKLGFTYVTLDIEGFKSGRMNEGLDEKERRDAFQ